ncbi:lysin [Nostocales cyanobacterium HT-58-2]|nr:lysin [Nostocales cyanobacterium HT-58-2]
MRLQDLVKSSTILDFNYLYQDKELAQQIQTRLSALGLLSGKADGAYGPHTQTALYRFTQSFKLPSMLTPEVVKALIEAKSIPSALPLPGIDLIKQFEGCYLNAYPDPLSGGKPITIGWGCTRKQDGGEWKLGDRISQQEADELLIQQLEQDYLPHLQQIPCWHELNVNQQGALLSFAYNLGAQFYGSPNFTSITNMLRTRDWSRAREIFAKYCNPGSNVESGLRRRRKTEAELFLKPI